MIDKRCARALLALVSIVSLSCTDEDLPSTPEQPFLRTAVELTRGVQPLPETPIQAGQSVRIRYGIAYTLAPVEARMPNLALYVSVYGLNQQDSLLVIGTLPNKEYPLAAASGLTIDSLQITVPNQAVSVTLEAFIDTIAFSNPVLEISRTSWPVQ